MVRANAIYYQIATAAQQLRAHTGAGAKAFGVEKSFKLAPHEK
jgi:hypothetical protein